MPWRNGGALQAPARSKIVRLLALAGPAFAVVAAAPGAAAAAQHPGHAAPAAAAHAKPTFAPMTAALAAKLSENVNQRVIVVMRKQFAQAHAGTSAAALRSAMVTEQQVPVLTELRAVHATHIKSFTLVNAVAATVSASEISRLRSDPAVSEVIPDVVIRVGASQLRESAAAPGKRATRPAVTYHLLPGACSASPQLDPEGLALTKTASYSKSQPTARSLGFTGTGVTVAYIADGIDVRNVNFLRKNGQSVFTAQQDFSGDGPGQPTGGGEAFIDANAIAGQGRHVYNVQHFGAQADPSACEIRIEGVAPGASLVGLDAVGENEDTFVSSFLQAINYAVQTAHVKVLDESYTANPFPDISSLDVFKQFNDAAVAAGVVVVVPTGDAGATNTIGSPASDPEVISVGASTDFRFYAQTNASGADYFATKGWLDDQVSAISSSGYDESDGVVDLVAPGDASFASCDANPAQFSDCFNFNGQASAVEVSIGTDESAPLVAGAAALVIQAYRRTHGGTTPTPALVKQILMSTATDLGAPTQEQGAGLLNSYRAVQLADSIPTSTRRPARVGSTLLKSVTQFNAIKAPGQAANFQLKITNSGAATQTIHISGRTLGPDEDVQNGKVTLNDASSPQFIDDEGVTNNYATFKFKVNPGQARLDADIAYPAICGCDTARTSLILINPGGRFAGDSLPQGVSNNGNVDVTDPSAGTWTGVVFSDVASAGGTNGVVRWRAETERYIRFGQVSPASVTLRPGGSQVIHIHEQLPPLACDRSGSIVFASSTAGTTTIPVTLRTRIAFNASGTGNFRGVLSGGNGAGIGQIDYYAFKVGAGVRNMRLDIALTNDAFDQIGAYLVDPDGQVDGYGQNSFNGIQSTFLTAFADNPMPGNWTLIVDYPDPVLGNEPSQIFHGSITFDAARVSAAGLPDSASTILASGTPVTVPVTVTNTGNQPEEVFADARLESSATYTLSPLDPATGVTLPLTGNPPFWFVPTHVTKIAVAATASVPIEFDYGSFSGDPDLVSSVGTSAQGSYTVPAGNLSNGLWVGSPDEIGPYAAPAPAGTVSMAMTVKAAAFDPAVTSSTGDIEQLAVNPALGVSLITINPGGSAKIDVTITPSAPKGTIVSGTLYVDDFMDDVPPYFQEATDELAGIPYKYTVG